MLRQFVNTDLHRFTVVGNFTAAYQAGNYRTFQIVPGTRITFIYITQISESATVYWTLQSPAGAWMATQIYCSGRWNVVPSNTPQIDRLKVDLVLPETTFSINGYNQDPDTASFYFCVTMVSPTAVSPSQPVMGVK